MENQSHASRIFFVLFFFFGFNGRTSERFDESHEAGVGHLLKKKKKRKKMEQVLVLTIVLSFFHFIGFGVPGAGHSSLTHASQPT